jgi:uncharacterized protein involved in copper resistance
MPTVNPRINVTLPPSLDALVAQLAGLQRVSKSQVLRELLEAAEPALQRAVSLMEAASRAAGELKTGLVRTLDAEQKRAEVELARQLQYMDSATSDLVAQAEAIRARRPSRSGARTAAVPPKAAQDPPSSNRGVKSSRKSGQTKSRRVKS